MTYRVKALVKNSEGGQREIQTNIAGCRDELHAREKMSELYPVLKFKSVVLVSELQKR